MERIECFPGIVIEQGKHYSHPNALSDGGCSEGCCDDYYCPDCGTSFRVEAAD